MKMVQTDPALLEGRQTFLWGLVKIYYMREDRRPGTTPEQIRELGYRYKHWVSVHILGRRRLHWFIHSPYECDDQPYED